MTAEKGVLVTSFIQEGGEGLLQGQLVVALLRRRAWGGATDGLDDVARACWVCGGRRVSAYRQVLLMLAVGSR